MISPTNPSNKNTSDCVSATTLLLPSNDLATYEEDFYQNGYIVVRNRIPTTIVREWSKIFAHPSFLQSIFNIMYENHHIVSPSPTVTLTPPNTGTSSSPRPTTDTTTTSIATTTTTTTSNVRVEEDTSTCSKKNPLATTTTATEEHNHHSNHHPQRKIIDGTSNSHQTSMIQYTMSCGVKYGYREIVMRSPGRYEIALLSLLLLQPPDPIMMKNSTTHCRHMMKQHHTVFLNDTEPDVLMSSIIHTIQTSLSFVPNLLNQKQHNPRCNTDKDNKMDSMHSVPSDMKTAEVPSQQQQQQQQQRYTWSDVTIINISIIISTPGSTDQKWHADGGHVNLEQHVPCHCCNIFIPLTAITLENGPTEFRPRSHYYTRQLTKMMLLAKVRKELQPIDAPLISSLGDVILFDYRILHRGRGNRTMSCPTHPPTTTVNDPESSAMPPKQSSMDVHVDPSHQHTDNNDNNNNINNNNNNNRVILVVTVSLPWFHDVLNYPKSMSIYDTVTQDYDARNHCFYRV